MLFYQYGCEKFSRQNVSPGPNYLRIAPLRSGQVMLFNVHIKTKLLQCHYLSLILWTLIINYIILKGI